MILLAGILRAEIIGSEPRPSTLPVADVIDAWLASEEGPCVRCSARTRIYGPRGNPLCADCRPPGTEEIPFAALGAAEILGRWPGHPGALALLAVAGTVIGEPTADAAWPWPAPRLSYANAAIAEAVIAAGQQLGHSHLLRDGLRMLGCLLSGETRNGHLTVVPAEGWGRGEDRPAFDQHPSQVAALADACTRAAAVTGDTTWIWVASSRVGTSTRPRGRHAMVWPPA